jgi:hypothetical protein
LTKSVHFLLTIYTAGYFGDNLIINTVISQTPDVNGKKTALIHELGHILGFKHTDEFADNTSIFNSAVVCDDYYLSSSFMYGGMTYNQVFNGFSSCDKQNLQYYWGY